MLCPNCKTQNLKYICKSCGIDIISFTKAIKISNTLYNRGLRKAKEGDLTGAAESLIQSLIFNKNNYQTRNLLGLIYYETGQTGDALKQWILSTNMFKTGNFAVMYMQLLQNNPDIIYGRNDAVVIYNKAIVHVERKLEEMAITELKKALKINPSFLMAHNLLSFCYIIQGKKEEALKHINIALKIDRYNPYATNYHIILTGKLPKKVDTQPKLQLVPKPATAPLVHTPVEESPGKGFTSIGLTHIAGFLIGALTIFGFLYFFVIPGWMGETDLALQAMTQERDSLLATYTESISRANSEIQELTLNLTATQELLTEASAQLQIFRHDQIFEDVQSLIVAGNHVEAAELLYPLDIDLMPPEQQMSMMPLRLAAFSGAALALYNEGLQHYNAGNFSGAVHFFERSLRFAEITQELTGELPNFADGAIYYLGRIFRHQNDYERALEFFMTIVEEHPDSAIFGSALSNAQQVSALMLQAANVVQQENENEDEE